MSQNHITSDSIPGRDQIDNTMLNTMGQYHGKVPWFYKFRVQLGIRDLAHTSPHAYATSPKQTRVCFVTHTFHHCSGPYWYFFLWYFINKLIKHQGQLHQVGFHHLHQVGCHQGQHSASNFQQSPPLDLMETHLMKMMGSYLIKLFLMLDKFINDVNMMFYK